MQPIKNLRASDQDFFSRKDSADFKVRNHHISAKKTYEITFSAIIIAVTVTIMVSNKLVLGGAICLLLGGVLYTVAKYLERYKKLLTATEFLSALLSSALGEGYDFVMIVKKDARKIVYLNNGFQTVFPEMVEVEFRKLDDLLTKYVVDEEIAKSIVSTVKKGAAKKFSLEIIASESEKKKIPMTFSIEPIARPTGFCLIRGKAKD